MLRGKHATIATACLLAGAAAFAVGVTQAQSGDPQRPPARGGREAKAVSLFSGFRRGDAADVDPKYRARAVSGLMQTNPDLDASTFRLLRRQAQESGPIDVYAAAGTDSICTITRHTESSGTLGSSGCGRATDDASRPLVHGSVQFDEDGNYLVSVLVPDGVTNLRLAFQDGRSTDLPIANGVAVYLGSQQPSRLTYTRPDGTQASDDYGLPTRQPSAGG